MPGERTLLAWDRTALALLGNGALLALRDAGTDHPLRLGGAVIAALLAALCGVLARRRAHAITHRRQALPAPTVAVAVLSLGTLVLCALELCAIAGA